MIITDTFIDYIFSVQTYFWLVCPKKETLCKPEWILFFWLCSPC